MSLVYVQLDQSNSGVFYDNFRFLQGSFAYDVAHGGGCAPFGIKEDGRIYAIKGLEWLKRTICSLWDKHAWDVCKDVAPEIDKMIDIIKPQSNGGWGGFQFKGDLQIFEFHQTIEMLEDRRNKAVCYLFKGRVSL